MITIQPGYDYVPERVRQMLRGPKSRASSWKGTHTRGMCAWARWALWGGESHPLESDSFLLFIDRGTSARPSIPCRHDTLWNPCSDDWRVCHHFRHCVGSLHILWGRHNIFDHSWVNPRVGSADWFLCLALQIEASSLISASVMAAPSALALSKLIYPEVEESKFKNKEGVKMPRGWVQWGI